MDNSAEPQSELSVAEKVKDQATATTAVRRGLWDALKGTTFRSLRHGNYRRYFLGQIISFTGSWMQSAALMWLLYDRTGDPRWPSWILGAQVGPTVLLGTFGGGLADRYPKRQLIFITQSIFLVHALILTFFIAFNILTPWLIVGLMVLSGVVQAADLPARLAFVPDLVPKEDIINAVGLNSLLFNSARAVGPAIAGLVFLLAEAISGVFPAGSSPVTIGAVACFAFNAISFVAVLIALWGITVSGAAKKNRHGPPASAWDGFRYLAQHPTLGGLVVLTLFMCIFGWPLLTVLPAYTRLELKLSEQTYSLLVSAVGVGALLAALTTATFGSRARKGPFLVLGAVTSAIGLFCLSETVSAGLAGVSCAVAGFGLILYLSTGQSTMQLAVPDEKRGRVMAVWAMTLSASAPIGHLLAGEAITFIGVPPVLLGMAIGVGFVAIAMGVMLAWQRMG